MALNITPRRTSCRSAGPSFGLCLATLLCLRSAMMVSSNRNDKDLAKDLSRDLQAEHLQEGPNHPSDVDYPGDGIEKPGRSVMQRADDQEGLRRAIFFDVQECSYHGVLLPVNYDETNWVDSVLTKAGVEGTWSFSSRYLNRFANRFAIVIEMSKDALLQKLCADGPLASDSLKAHYCSFDIADDLLEQMRRASVDEFDTETFEELAPEGGQPDLRFVSALMLDKYESFKVAADKVAALLTISKSSLEEEGFRVARGSPSNWLGNTHFLIDTHEDAESFHVRAFRALCAEHDFSRSPYCL